MAKIKNMGTSTARFNEGIIIDGTVGNTGNALVVTGSIIATEITGTISHALYDQMGSTLVGGIFEIDQGLFQNPNSSYNPIYFPSDDSYVERVGVSSVNYFIAPFDGELIKIQIRSPNRDFSSTSLTASFHLGSEGDNAYSSTAAEKSSIAGLGINSVHTFDFGNSTFNEGQIFGFSLYVENGFVGTESIHFTTVIRYNPYG